MDRILLHLSSSPEQEAALEQLLADQQDPASPRYHTWLTPEEFGRQFGAGVEDIERISDWLRSEGFQVTEIAAGRRAIEFSGTASQVEAAFRTEIHRYRWNGRHYVANFGDISIPSALAPVVRGVVSLDDFGVRPFHHVVSTPAPLANFSGGVHGLSPYDFATIYNLLPLWNGGYDGAGQKIAIVGQSGIALSDVSGFRAISGLPVNSPTVIVNGRDPGIIPADETESDLDVEWAGAVAKGANIVFVTSASTNASDGVTLSAQYIVQHAAAPVMSVSYGLCEGQLGAASAFYGSLWQQAAAEGIAVFVAAGDSGSAGCDSAGSSNPATQGFAINGLGSTAYNVAVGGTEFDDAASPATYWNSVNTNQLASARGYIPELVWNESGDNSLFAGGGGASLVWKRPAWQNAPGVPGGTARLVPDVSLSAAGHDGYIIEQHGGLYLVGGTSAAAPAFAGLMAIVNQFTHSVNGNPNSRLYALASTVPSIFHDITSGSNAVRCAGGSRDCSTPAPASNVGMMTGYSAATGFDLATGLGSVDANALVMSWSGTAPAPVIVSLNPNPMTGSSSSQTLTINGSGFAPGSGLAVTIGKATYQGNSVSYVSSSQLNVAVTVGTAAQTLPVQVRLAGGSISNTATLTVIEPAAVPVIGSLSPNPMMGSASAQSLVIAGSGFSTGSGLKVTIGSTTYQGSQITAVSSTRLTVNVVVGTASQSLPVQVIGGNGIASSPATLIVTAPAMAPAISALSPNPMTGTDSPQYLTISGKNFSGAGLKVTVGTTVYQGSQVVSASSTLLVVAVNVGASAQQLPVAVTNSDGQSSSPVYLAVTAPQAIPVIYSLNPNPITASTSAQLLVIRGEGFVSGGGLKVIVGGTVYQGPQITSGGSSTQLTVRILAADAGQSLPVVVTNPNGRTSNTVNLGIAAPIPAPAITSLNPNPLTGSNSPQLLTISGTGFQPGLKLSIGGTLILANQLAALTPGYLQLYVITGLSAHSYAVQVVNANAGVSNIVNLRVNSPPAFGKNMRR